ncbi:VMAP-C domain-containing protein [Streptomyces daghestanicus]|uniref:Serine protease n=1 Tax=Streptomyces daghestanicus TaxID=66885 RepID=A0ABQ3QAV2_9ACTN|nr:trypsin-like peptidase domain-containing protein [Streptomyces daghestanicus]GGU43610.1 serine protease [Streptomyces daghestanicus]GHI34395.1 serine protease [Streptomyces daghestanicus]
MTGRASFHVRIECGRRVGAGFLVTRRLVLTCAHVVQDADTATVVFPGHRDLGDVTARVFFRGGWQGHRDDPGDLAVLELEREVPVRPAVFAPPGAERRDPAPELIAYGFPGALPKGVLASYRAVPGPLIAGEWVQLEALTAHGQTLVGGFSGAAATLSDGTVVGMVTSTTSTHVGRMLPVEVLARHWEGLGGLVPAPAPPPDAGRLELLLGRAERLGLDCDPNRLYASSVDPFAPEPEELFHTLRQAADYVRREVPGVGAEDRFADQLERALEERLTPLPGRVPGPRPAAASAWTPIVVELARSGAGPDQVTVEVSAYRDGHRRPVGTRRVPQDAVPAYVQERVDAAFNQLDRDAEALLAFVLPYEWLDKPVAQWECSAYDPTPLGCAHPVVVAERSRHRSSRARHELSKKWQELDARSDARLHRVACGTRENPRSLRMRLRDEAAALAGFTSVGEHFRAGLSAPVPVLLWRRTGCPGDDHAGACAGTAFLERLAESVEGVSPAELPRRVMDLREEAYAADDPEGHWAREVQVLWDDPRCFPEPAACLHSPVG